MLRLSQIVAGRRLAALVLGVASTCTVTAPAHAQTEDVVWQGVVGATVAGNDLTKTASTIWGNSGARSLQTLESNGFVEFSATGIGMLGLSKGDTDQNYADIDFAILAWSGALYVYEAGNSRGSFGAVTPSDKLRVQAAGGVVRYFKNGVVFYTSTVAARSPLLVDAALNSTGSTLTDVRIGQTSFSGLVGVTVAEQTLAKTATTGWNAGAASGRRIFWVTGSSSSRRSRPTSSARRGSPTRTPARPPLTSSLRSF